MGTLLLCIIANIFCKSINYMYHCQIFILMHKKGYYKYFPTSCILFTEWLFFPKFANFRPIQLDIIDGAAVAEWLSSWLAEQEDRGSIPHLAIWIFRDWLSPASKSRYGWKIAKSTLILKTTNQSQRYHRLYLWKMYEPTLCKILH